MPLGNFNCLMGAGLSLILTQQGLEAAMDRADLTPDQNEKMEQAFDHIEVASQALMDLAGEVR